MNRVLTYKLILLLAFTAWINLYSQEQPFIVERAAFSNRSYDEYSPYIINGNIVFRANKRLNVVTKNADESGNTSMNLFIVRNLGNGEWSEPQLFANELSGLKDHFGPATFNDRGNRIWFNKINEESDEKRSKIGIFSGGYIGGEWTGIQPFQYNDPRYDFMHPYLSQDGNLLFFASNMQGGQGGYDLYVCRLTGTQWSAPENLGPNINSSRNEIYPVHYPDGRLYFSSNGLDPNFGGFDLYYSVSVDGEWSLPVHLEAPFNTRRNESWFMLTDTSYTRGYIHSDREGRIYNIFEFNLDIPEGLYDNCILQEQNSYCFTFYEAGTMQIDTTVYKYEWVVDGNKFRQAQVDYCFDGVGNYTIALNVIDLLSGSVLFNEATYELDIEDIEQVYISSPDTVFVNEPIRFNGKSTNLKEFTIDRYLWNMDDFNWASDTVVDHRFFNPGTYSIRLGVVDAAEQPEDIKKTCGFKRIVVLPKIY